METPTLHAVFTFAVFDADTQYHMRFTRRFNECRELYVALEDRYQGLSVLASFPSRTLFSRVDDDFLANRTRELDYFFKYVRLPYTVPQCVKGALIWVVMLVDVRITPLMRGQTESVSRILSFATLNPSSYSFACMLMMPTAVRTRHMYWNMLCIDCPKFVG